MVSFIYMFSPEQQNKAIDMKIALDKLNGNTLVLLERAFHILGGSDKFHGEIVTKWCNGGLQYPKKPEFHDSQLDDDLGRPRPMSKEFWNKMVRNPIRAVLTPGTRSAIFRMNNGRLIGDPEIQ